MAKKEEVNLKMFLCYFVPLLFCSSFHNFGMTFSLLVSERILIEIP